jgi:GTP-dependent phosphoenolpyruvate carboxykinase
MENIAPAISPPSGMGETKPANKDVLDWVHEVQSLTNPENIFWCDGSEAENEYLLSEACRQQVLIRLNQEKAPGCYLHRSNPNDVARVEQFTLICTPTEKEAGPTNHWAEPAQTYSKLHGLLKGAMRAIEHDTLFTNVALTKDGDVWWEGKDGTPPNETIDWRGNPWTPASKEKAAHPNSRFATPMQNNPVLDSEVSNPRGVPISAIIFGGRRSDTMPLVFQADDWNHGVYIGATMASETTAAATGAVGKVRRDPMAMLPFCGYNIGDYFRHWLATGPRLTNPPLIFHVNWFRKDANGKFLWPGFGDNMRVLKWIIDRCEGRGGAAESPIGAVPRPEDLDLEGLQLAPEKINEVLAVKPEEWEKELAAQEEFFASLAPNVPEELLAEQKKVAQRLGP